MSQKLGLRKVSDVLVEKHRSKDNVVFLLNNLGDKEVTKCYMLRNDCILLIFDLLLLR